MRKKNSIVIIEDEFFVADHIKEVAAENGYLVSRVYESGEDFLEDTNWDFDAAIIDIFLAKKMTGLDVAKQLNEKRKPFIFLTANIDAQTLKKAAKLHPKAYIGKPFKDIDVQAALAIIFLNQAKRIKVQGTFGYKEIAPSDIVMITTDRNYLNIHTTQGIERLRNSLKEISAQLPSSFIQANRFTIVNKDMIEQQTHSQIKIGDHLISISRIYKASFNS